jgi:hypothetical protein
LRTERPSEETGPAVVCFSDDGLFDGLVEMTANRSQSK